MPVQFDRLRFVDRLTSAGIGEQEARGFADATAASITKVPPQAAPNVAPQPDAHRRATDAVEGALSDIGRRLHKIERRVSSLEILLGLNFVLTAVTFVMLFRLRWLIGH